MSDKNEALKAGLPEAVLEPSERWVRVMLGGETVADSRRTLLLLAYGLGLLPTYFFPEADVRLDALTEPRDRNGRRYWTVRGGDKVSKAAAWTYLAPPPGLGALRGHLTFVWDKMDAWYEEEERIFAHPRDPHKRVDVIPSSRHVKVVLDGHVVAETTRPHLLFETGLPTRYYIPRQDVRLEYLKRSPTSTRCPYKGQAEYWSVTVGDKTFRDLVWSYPRPLPEIPKIEGLLCFYNERADLYVDGVLQKRPLTPWS